MQTIITVFGLIILGILTLIVFGMTIGKKPKPLSPLPNSANSGIGITGDGSPIG